jgi:uncharacterized zinc-type alcohol dehydrogenase-like protein
MLDFCAKHKLVFDIEMIPIQQIDGASNWMQKSEVQYRLVTVIDNGSFISTQR